MDKLGVIPRAAPERRIGHSGEGTQIGRIRAGQVHRVGSLRSPSRCQRRHRHTAQETNEHGEGHVGAGSPTKSRAESVRSHAEVLTGRGHSLLDVAPKTHLARRGVAGRLWRLCLGSLRVPRRAARVPAFVAVPPDPNATALRSGPRTEHTLKRTWPGGSGRSARRWIKDPSSGAMPSGRIRSDR